nr:putative xaa-pro aminopeptidase [Quercus suber]
MSHIRLDLKGGVDKYPAKSHARRVAEKLKLRTGVVVLAGTRTQFYPGSDQPVFFRQDRYFYYLTGCPERDCYVSYDISSDHLTLWLPSIDKSRVVWNGRGSTVDEAMEKYDIDEAKYVFSSVASKVDAVELFAQSRLSSQGSSATYLYLSHPDLKQAMNACRVIKDEHEIALITQANDVSSAAHTEVLRRLHTFTNEAEVDAIYMQTCIKAHAKEQAYAPIVGAGSNGSVLHYEANNQDFADGQTMVIDAGCEVSCYASDITRTLPLNAKVPGHWPSKEAESVYELVERMQEECIKRMQPGTSFVAISQLARHIAIEGLLELGVLKGSRDEIYAAGTEFGFFPHGLGHHVGLEVHDVSPDPVQSTAIPDDIPGTPRMLTFSPYSAAPQVLEPGMVVTIEPGIYFNKFLLETFFLHNPKHVRYIDRHVLARYMQVGGVRIEDDILVTRLGYRNLTTAPKGKKMLQIIRDAASNSEREGYSSLLHSVEKPLAARRDLGGVRNSGIRAACLQLNTVAPWPAPKARGLRDESATDVVQRRSATATPMVNGVQLPAAPSEMCACAKYRVIDMSFPRVAYISESHKTGGISPAAFEHLHTSREKGYSMYGCQLRSALFGKALGSENDGKRHAADGSTVCDPPARCLGRAESHCSLKIQRRPAAVVIRWYRRASRPTFDLPPDVTLPLLRADSPEVRHPVATDRPSHVHKRSGRCTTAEQDGRDGIEPLQTQRHRWTVTLLAVSFLQIHLCTSTTVYTVSRACFYSDGCTCFVAPCRCHTACALVRSQVHVIDSTFKASARQYHSELRSLFQDRGPASTMHLSNTTPLIAKSVLYVLLDRHEVLVSEAILFLLLLLAGQNTLAWLCHSYTFVSLVTFESLSFSLDVPVPGIAISLFARQIKELSIRISLLTIDQPE